MQRFTIGVFVLYAGMAVLSFARRAAAEEVRVEEDDEKITIETDALSAVIKKRGYVSGVAGGTLVDKQSGFRDAGFGLDIVDWIMEPGSDEPYRQRLESHMIYEFDNAWHGKRAKRMIEGPQICTKAGEIDARVIRGRDFVAVELTYAYRVAAPGKETGSKWTQRLVFLPGKRYFLAADRIDAVNNSDAMFLRLDMPGHIKHDAGDTFSHVYLSYLNQVQPASRFENGLIPSGEFATSFAPDERFNYRRDSSESPPDRFIRAYRLRDKESGAEGPWLAGMTLDPTAVYEAWCHQRGYVCMIEEIGGRPVKAGESFGAAYIVGYFDTIKEMQTLYDAHRGAAALEVTERGWRLR